MLSQPTKRSTQKNNNAKNGNGIFSGGVLKISLFKNKIATQWNSDTHIGSVFRNMAKLATGEGMSRLIGFVAMPIITRIYLPEHMGVLAVFITIVTLMGSFGTFRYSLAIPLPKSDGVAINIGVLSSIILFSTAMLSFIIFFIFGSKLLSLFSMEQLIPYWWLIPIAFVGAGVYELLSNWAIRERAFYPLARTKVWQKTIGSSLKIGLGLAGLMPLGLLIGHIFTQAGGIISLLRVFYRKLKSNVRHVTRNRIKFVSMRYSDFPKYRASSKFLLTLSSKLPLLFFAWYYGAEVAGQIGLALMMLSIPITLLGYTTGKAFYAEIAKIGMKYPDEILKVTKSITKKLILVSILPFLILFFGGPWIFEFVFGELWYDAGVFASILAIYLLVQFLYSPIGDGIFNVFERQSKVFLIDTSRIILTIIVFIFAYLISLSPSESLGIYSIVLTLHYSAAIYIVFSVIRSSRK